MTRSTRIQDAVDRVTDLNRAKDRLEDAAVLIRLGTRLTSRASEGLRIARAIEDMLCGEHGSAETNMDDLCLEQQAEIDDLRKT